MRFIFTHIVIIALIFVGCRGLEKSEKEKICKANAIDEPIYRLSDETCITVEPGHSRLRERYPWEERLVGDFPAITKEFFRCKGSHSHSDIVLGDKVFRDCGGIETHSLPIQDRDEFVYPILLNLLNYVQAQMKRQVVVVCAHRCPLHQAYATHSSEKKISKHMMGAEVDFYVNGAEDKPYEAVKYLMQYYRDDPDVLEKKPFTQFFEASSSQNGVSSWMNREIIIRIHHSQGEEDLDHPTTHPFITIELRYDRISGKRVDFNWNQAHQCLNLYQMN
ncbi:MAG: hypothetical protein K9M07_00185 [Simkaniaceae bacterium]|nr:hypothetical protein [Simkaniaceae bacterium]MCF7851641.1 hypothetical protein [Simkaniaceae bacterium]